MAYHKGGPVNSGRAGAWHDGRWVDDVVVIPEAQRVMPPTVSHDVVATHPYGCGCSACSSYPRPLLGRLKRQMRSVSSATTVST